MKQKKTQKYLFILLTESRRNTVYLHIQTLFCMIHMLHIFLFKYKSHSKYTLDTVLNFSETT